MHPTPDKHLLQHTKNIKMSNQTLAKRLRQAIIDSDLATIHGELFSEKVESIEPEFTPIPHAKGIHQVKEKAKMFGGNIKELHSKSVSDQVIATDKYIALEMSFDFTAQDGSRNQMEEIVVYKTEDGKIISEQFFYS